MSERRTLEELKLLLRASHAAEQELISKRDALIENLRNVGTQWADPDFKVPSDLTKEQRRSKIARLAALNDRLKGREETTIVDEFGGKHQVLKETPKAYRKGKFERSRRKLIADQLRQVRKDFPNPKQAAAHLYDILRADVDAGKKTVFGFSSSIKNPLIDLTRAIDEAPADAYDSLAEEDFYRRNYEDGDSSDYEFDPDEHNKEIDREAKKREKEEVNKARKKGAFSKRNLRRTPTKDLMNLLGVALSRIDPDAALSVTEELNRRGLDEVNRGMSRRKMIGKTVGQAVKPNLPKSVPGTGGAGEQIAKTFLRLITRGRGL